MKQEKVLLELKKNLKKHLPSGIDIIYRTIESYGGKKLQNVSWIKKNFSKIIEEVQLHAYDLYKVEERNSVAITFREVFGKQLKESSSKEDFFGLLEKNFWALDRFFLGLTQGRRPRAGKAFEYIIKHLFDILEYPYTPQPIINGQPDFLLPSVEHFRKNAMDCVIFTVKRTLRERWRQIVTEGTRGYLFFLATIDDNIAARDLEQIQGHRIYLVMPERIRKEKYSDQVNVISFESFFELHLDPAMTRWKKNKVID